MKLIESLRNSVKKLEAELKDSNLFDHMGDRGEFREKVLTNFLRPFLPKCYGLSSGAVYDVEGNGSKQLDIILYDEMYSNVLFKDSTNQAFPVESIFGVIEVKSSLSSEALDNTLENIKSLKKLYREPTDILDFNPLHRLNIGTGLSYDRRKCNPYLGMCFAYDGNSGQKTLERLKYHLSHLATEAERDYLPDFIFNYRQGYFILRCTRQNDGTFHPCRLGSPFDDLCLISAKEDTLPLFFLTINICLNQIRLRTPDLNTYWIKLVELAIAK